MLVVIQLEHQRR